MTAIFVVATPAASTGLGLANFFLICFAVGFCFSFLSFVLGGLRFGHLHLPHAHGVHVPTHGPGIGHSGAMAGAKGGVRAAGQGSQVSPFNLVSFMAFLAWFGGTGFLLTKYSALWVGFELLIAIAAGLAGAASVFLFMARVLMREDEHMNPADYEMVGVLGRVCSPIREGGTGELIYSQEGTRRVCGARSEDGSAIVKGTEVVVTRYEKGIAYVKLWSEIAGEDSSAS
jgi:membrane protein implicated in regulation of membrane protease activity